MAYTLIGTSGIGTELNTHSADATEFETNLYGGLYGNDNNIVENGLNNGVPEIKSDAIWLSGELIGTDLTARQIKYKVTANTGTSERTGNLYLEYNGKKSINILVKQPGKSDDYIFTGPSGEVEVYANSKLVSDPSKSLKDLVISTNSGSNVVFELNGGAEPDINKTDSEKTGIAIYRQNESNKSVQVHWKQRAAIKRIIWVFIGPITGKEYTISVVISPNNNITSFTLEVLMELTYSVSGSKNDTIQLHIGKNNSTGTYIFEADSELTPETGAIIKEVTVKNPPDGYYQDSENNIYIWSIIKGKPEI